MPGPVSQSNPGPRDPTLKELWKAELDAMGRHYFVLDIEDVFRVMSGSDAKALNKILEKYNAFRLTCGKKARGYYVFRRDYRCAPQAKALLEAELGITIQEP